MKCALSRTISKHNRLVLIVLCHSACRVPPAHSEHPGREWRIQKNNKDHESSPLTSIVYSFQPINGKTVQIKANNTAIPAMTVHRWVYDRKRNVDALRGIFSIRGTPVTYSDMFCFERTNNDVTATETRTAKQIRARTTVEKSNNGT